MIINEVHHVFKCEVGFLPLDVAVVEQTPVNDDRNKGKVHGITPKDLPQLLCFKCDLLDGQHAELEATPPTQHIGLDVPVHDVCFVIPYGVMSSVPVDVIVPLKLM